MVFCVPEGMGAHSLSQTPPDSTSHLPLTLVFTLHAWHPPYPEFPLELKLCLQEQGSSLQEIQQCHTVSSPFFSLHVFNTSVKWETSSHYSVQAPAADTALASSWTTSCELTVKKYFPEVCPNGAGLF